MERIYEFLPSVLILACVAVITRFYLKWIVKRFGDNYTSVKWHEQNRWKIIWSVETPAVMVWGPAAEELVFRAPLIIAFGALSSMAWYGIFISSGLFAALHWFGKKIFLSEIVVARENNEHESDDVGDEVYRLYKEKGKFILLHKAINVVATFILGILAGYCGIKCQSVWLAVGIHSAWNLIMPVVIVVLMIPVAYLVCAMAALWKKLRRKS